MSATFDSKTIVMMAENGHSVEIDGKKIQMTIVQEAVEAKPDYSHLVGKWLRCTELEDGWNSFFKIGQWYKVQSVLDNHPQYKGFNFQNEAWAKFNFFDLSNPLDHNPDEVRVFDVPSEIKISEDSDGFNLHFSERQCLWYSKETHCYGVLVEAAPKAPIPCIATECKFEDLREGDLFFATDDEKPDFTSLVQYSFLNNDKGLVWTDGSDIYTVAAGEYTHYFKITPKP